MKKCFDRSAKQRSFEPGDLVFRWDSRREESRKHGKFDHKWFGPYVIATIVGRNSFSLQNLGEEILEIPVNGHFLKHFLS